MALKIYADECVDGRVINGLRRRGADIVTAADEGLLSASDEQHLARAIELDRVIVSADVDFLRLVSEKPRDSHVPGLIFISHSAPVGAVVSAIVLVTHAFEPKDMVNWVEWVP